MTSDVCTTLGFLDPLLPLCLHLETPPPFSVDVKVFTLRPVASFGQSCPQMTQRQFDMCEQHNLSRGAQKISVSYLRFITRHRILRSRRWQSAPRLSPTRTKG